MLQRCECEICSMHRKRFTSIARAKKLEVVGQLAKFHVKTSSIDNADDDCCICLEALSTEKYVCHVGCGHYMHPECLARWFFENPSCPQCRLHPDDLDKSSACVLCLVSGMQMPSEDYRRAKCCRATVHLYCFRRFMDIAKPDQRNCPMCTEEWNVGTIESES